MSRARRRRGASWKLSVLKGERMLVLSRYWVTHPDARAAFKSHEMGPPLEKELYKAYKDVRRVELRRRRVKNKLSDLTRTMKALNKKHARLTRVLDGHLIGLAGAAEDPDDTAWYEDIRTTLLPIGHKVINRSYEYKAGMVEQIEEALTQEIMERMDRIVVGDHTLGDLCRSWLSAARELGDRMIERDRLEASITGKGLRNNKLGIREVRGTWMRVVQVVISVVEIIELATEHRDALLLPLECMIANAEREQRGSSGAESSAPDDQIVDQIADDQMADDQMADDQMINRYDIEKMEGYSSLDDVEELYDIDDELDEALELETLDSGESGPDDAVAPPELPEPLNRHTHRSFTAGSNLRLPAPVRFPRLNRADVSDPG